MERSYIVKVKNGNNTEDDSGSGFVYSNSEYWYFFTAKHILKSFKLFT